MNAAAQGASLDEVCVRHLGELPELFQEPPQVLNLRFEELSLRLLTNAQELRAVLADYFAPFLAPEEPAPAALAALTVVALAASSPELALPLVDWPRDPGKTGRKEEFCDLSDGRVIRKVKTGMVFFLGGTQEWATTISHDLGEAAPQIEPRQGLQLALGPVVEHANQIINFINTQVLRTRLEQGFVLGHAAAVLHAGRGVAIAARSGAGKSTLAMHLMHAGATFLSNDRVLFGRNAENHAEMAGIPKWPRVNPGTLLNNPSLSGILSDERRLALEGLSEAELWQLEEKYDVLVPDVFGPKRAKFRSRLNVLLLLNWEHGSADATRVAPVQLLDRDDLLELIYKSAGPLAVGEGGKTYGRPGEHDREALLEALTGVAVLECTGRPDFAMVVREIATWGEERASL